MYHSFQIVTQPALGFKAGEREYLLGSPMAEAAAGLGAPDKAEAAAPGSTAAPGCARVHRYCGDGAEFFEDGQGRLCGARFMPRGGELGGDKLAKADLISPKGSLIIGASPADIAAAYGEPQAGSVPGRRLAYAAGGGALCFDFRDGALDAVCLAAGGLPPLGEPPAAPAARRAADTSMAERLTMAGLVAVCAYALYRAVVHKIFASIMAANPNNEIYIFFYGGIIVLAVIAVIGGAAGSLLWWRVRPGRAGKENSPGPWSTLGAGLNMGLAIVAGAALLVLALFLWVMRSV
jgi:hypothetical protein